MMKRMQSGFSLIELVFFIAIIGVLAAGLSVPFSTLFTQAHTINDQTRAVELAKEGMEFAIGQRRLKGFAAVSTSTVQCGSTPCIVGNNTLAVTVTSLNVDFKKIRSIVTGAGNATLTTIVANY